MCKQEARYSICRAHKLGRERGRGSKESVRFQSLETGGGGSDRIERGNKMSGLD